jgi:hypothetical protein
MRHAFRAGHRALIPLAGVAVASALLMASSPAWADPTKTQCIEANTRAQDLRRELKLAEAREQLVSCATTACPAMVRDDCTRRLDELDQAQPTIVFDAKDASGGDLTAVKVTVDGRVLAEALDGAALRVDPGAHTFTFEVAGQPPVTGQYLLHEGEKGRRERVVLYSVNAPRPAPVPEPAPSPVPAPAPATPAPPALARDASRVPGVATEPPAEGDVRDVRPTGRTQQTVGVVLGIAGAVSLAIGGIFGALSLSAHNAYEANCGPHIGAPQGKCNQDGVTGESNAAGRGDASTIFFAAGAGAAILGGVIYFSAPKSGSPVAVRVGPAGVAISGAL